MMVFRQGIALAIMGLACTAAIAQDTKIKGKETPAQKRADRAEARADRLSRKAGENLNRHLNRESDRITADVTRQVRFNAA